MRKLSIKYFLFAGFLVVFFLFGCQTVIKEEDRYRTLFSSPSGKLAEEILPETSLGFVSLNLPSDDQNNEMFALLSKVLPADIFSKENIIQTIDRELEPFSMSYSSDIKPFLTDKSRIVFSISSDFSNEHESQLYYYLVLYAENKSEADKFYTKLKKTQLFTEEFYGSSNFLIEKSKGPSSLYVLPISDLIVIGNGLEKAKQIIDLSTSKGNSLYQRENFLKITKSTTETHSFFLYLSAENILKFAKKRQIISDSAQEDILFWRNWISLSILAFAQDDALAFKSAIYSPQEVLEYRSFERYLYKELPAKDAIVYLEGADLSFWITEIMRILSSGADNFTQFYGFIKQTFADITSRDLEKDFLAWMNKGFALSINNNGNKVIPGFTLAVDADQNPVMAREFIKRLDAQIDEYIAQLAQEKDSQIYKALRKESVQIGGGDFTMLSFDFNQLRLKDVGTGFSMIPLSLFSENAVVYYGVTQNNRFIISSFQRFASDYGLETFDKNEDFKVYNSHISKYPEGLLYFNKDNLFRYIDTYISFYEKLTLSETADKLKLQFEPIKILFQGVKGLVYALKREENMIFGRGGIITNY